MKRKIFNILFALILALSFTLVVVPMAERVAASPATLHVIKWTEDAANPIFDPAAKAYYPTVVKVSDSDYRMWYGSDSGIGYATSADGLSWTEQANPVTGLRSANHPLVEYIDDKFRMWYWDTSQLYSISAIRYAESSDGIAWTNDQPITGNIISGVDGEWNRGSYGPIDLIYNPAASNTGSNPFDYSFALYFDATTGGFEEIGLGYSSNGVDWKLYGKVLPRGNDGPCGNTDTWDSSYTTFGSVIKESDNVWHMWFCGGQKASNEGIGYAYSTDGLIWTRSANNPIMHKDDGVLWRADRTYAPMVIHDGSKYKMWFSGKDATGNYAIGYATANVAAGPPAGSVSAAANTNLGTVNFSISNSCISPITVISPGNMQNLPAGYSFPYGFFGFNINNLTPGGSTQVTIKFPNPLPLGVKYFKIQNGRAVDCSSIMTRPEPYTIILRLTDGDVGDADGIANGTIVDPGGPAFPMSVTPTSHQSSMPIMPQAPVQLSNINVKAASLSATKVSPGSQVTVTAHIANTGTGNGSSVIKFYVNGSEEYSQPVTVNSGGSTTVTHDIIRNEPGTYTVYVNGTNAGSFTVDMFAGNDMLIYGIIALFMIGIIGTLYLLVRRRTY